MANEVAKTVKCESCGATLSEKERLTCSLLKTNICDSCVCKNIHNKRVINEYREKLKTMPAAYRGLKESRVSEKLIVLESYDNPIYGTQILWSNVKHNWMNNKPATYMQANDIYERYSACPFSDKKEYLESVKRTPGLLLIDDVQQKFNVDVLSPIIEYRNDEQLETMISIHVPKENLAYILSPRAYASIVDMWIILELESESDK